MIDQPTRRSRRGRFIAALAAAVLAAGISPVAGLASAPAYAAGDVCDICSLNFDVTACEKIGGWPYDSTLESPPPAVAGGGASAPQPAAPPPPPAPAPQAPAQPAPAPQQPATGGTSSVGSTSSGTATTPGSNAPAVVAAVPQAPTLVHRVDGRTLTLTWSAPADGGAALTGYKLVLNDGTPIPIAADATGYELELRAGEYDAVLIAVNGAGESLPSAAVTGIEISEADKPAPQKTADASDAVAASSERGGASPLIGGVVIGGLVLAAGGLLTWWWLRRRSVTPQA